MIVKFVRAIIATFSQDDITQIKQTLSRWADSNNPRWARLTVWWIVRARASLHGAIFANKHYAGGSMFKVPKSFVIRLLDKHRSHSDMPYAKP